MGPRYLHTELIWLFGGISFVLLTANLDIKYTEPLSIFGILEKCFGYFGYFFSGMLVYQTLNNVAQLKTTRKSWSLHSYRIYSDCFEIRKCGLSQSVLTKYRKSEIDHQEQKTSNQPSRSLAPGLAPSELCSRLHAMWDESVPLEAFHHWKPLSLRAFNERNDKMLCGVAFTNSFGNRVIYLIHQIFFPSSVVF